MWPLYQKAQIQGSAPHIITFFFNTVAGLSPDWMMMYPASSSNLHILSFCIIPSVSYTSGPLSSAARMLKWKHSWLFPEIEIWQPNSVCMLILISQNISFLINNREFSQFSSSVSASLTLRACLISVCSDWPPRLHTASPLGLGPFILANTMEPDEDHSLSYTYLIFFICIPSTGMIFGRLPSRRGS